jgi:hypothetical protein
VVCGFVFVGAVGVGRRTAAIRAGKQQGAMRTGKLKSDTAAHPKAAMPTAVLKGAAECTGQKKPWLIGLQYRSLPGL